MNQPLLIEDITDLLAELHRSDQKPVVIVSARKGERRYGLSPRLLAADLSGRAVVAQLADVDVSWALSAARPDLATYGGAVRVVGVDGSSEVIRTDRDPDRCQRRIRNTVNLARRDEFSTTNPRSDTPPRSSADDTTTRPTPPAAPSVTPKPAASGTTAKPTTAAVSEPTDTTDAPGGAGRLIPLVNGPALFSDPDTQMRYDIGQMWLYKVSEPERQQWPLRAFQLSESFLASTRSTSLVSRERIVDVVVDVLTRRAFDMASRAVHPYGAGHASAPPITRDDGATAYRATIRHTAGGPRLLWWECCDGSVELAWVGHHDDTMPTPNRRHR